MNQLYNMLYWEVCKVSFSEQLKKIRKEQKISQIELANKLRVTQQTVSQYEKEIIVPKVDVIIKLAQIFNVPTTYFINDSTDQGISALPKDAQKLLEIFDSLPADKKNMSIELLKVLKGTSEKEG